MIQNRDEYVFKRVKEHLNFIKTKYPEYEVIFIGLQGSQNYDLDIYTNEYTSDVDTKAIIVPTLKQIALNRQPISTTVILPDNSHCDVKDVRVMFQTFKKQNINFLEILFTKYRIINPKYKDLLLDLIARREDIAHMNIAQSLRYMRGVSMEKKKALTHPFEGIIDKIEKYGYDGKQLHHIIRMNNFIIAYTMGKSFEECLTANSNKEMLMDAKLNKFTLQQALDLAELYDTDTNRIKEEHISLLDQTINEQTNNFIDEIQYEIIKRALENEVCNKMEPFDYNNLDKRYNNIYATSDIHFCHSNILKFEEGRLKLLDESINQYVTRRTRLDSNPQNIDELVTLYMAEYYKEKVDVMNEAIIKRWNNLVKKEDLVFILGDIALRYDSIRNVNNLIKQLNGDKVLVLGNHDYPIIESNAFDKTLFKDIVDYKVIKVYGKCISLFHYPIEKFFNQDKGGILLYGHIHSTKLEKEIPHAYNVGMDVNNYKPVNIKDFISTDNLYKDFIVNRH